LHGCSYFHDLTSGKCYPRPTNPSQAEWFVTSLSGAKGRQPNDKEHAQLLSCTWKSKEGHELGKDLECQVRQGMHAFTYQR
jgi:hypothetical protein